MGVAYMRWASGGCGLYEFSHGMDVACDECLTWCDRACHAMGMQ